MNYPQNPYPAQGSYYLTDPHGQSMQLSPEQMQSLNSPQAPPQIQITETATVKVYRRDGPAHARGFYGSFPAKDINDIEVLTGEKWGRGRYEWKVFDKGHEIHSWSSDVAGKDPIDNQSRPIIEDDTPLDIPRQQSYTGPVIQNGSQRREAQWPGQSPEQFYVDQVKELSHRCARLEHEKRELESLNRALEHERNDLRSQLSRATERAETQKLVGTLEAQVEAVRNAKNDGWMEKVLPKLFDNALTPQPVAQASDLDKDLDRLIKLKELTNSGGSDEDPSLGRELIRALPAVVAGLAPAYAGNLGEKTTAEAEAAQNGSGAAKEPAEAAVPFAREDFRPILQSGIAHMPEGEALTKWADSAARRLTKEGAEALLQVSDKGKGLWDWAKHVPGLRLDKLLVALKKEGVGEKRQVWLGGAIRAMKERLAA